MKDTAEHIALRKKIKSRHAAGISQRDLSLQFNISVGYIKKILNNPVNKPILLSVKPEFKLPYQDRDEQLFAIYSTIKPVNTTFHIGDMGRRQ